MPRKNRNRNNQKSKSRRSGRSRGYGPRSFVSQDRKTIMTLGGRYTASSDGSGVVSFVIPSDPTIINNGSTHPEWEAILSLWGEVKVMSLSIWVLPNYQESKSVNETGTPLFIAGSTNNTTPPGSVAVIADNASSRVCNLLNITNPSGFFYYQVWRDILWGPTGSPGGITSTGCPGGIGFYGDGYAASTPMVFVAYRLNLMLRNRQ